MTAPPTPTKFPRTWGRYSRAYALVGAENIVLPLSSDVVLKGRARGASTLDALGFELVEDVIHHHFVSGTRGTYVQWALLDNWARRGRKLTEAQRRRATERASGVRQALAGYPTDHPPGPCQDCLVRWQVFGADPPATP
jgi:hypothetical protein